MRRQGPGECTTAAAAVLCLFALAGCTGGHSVRAYSIAAGGDARAGKVDIIHDNCGSCHTIPGIHGAVGVVGPPLMFFSRRTMIAGELPNSPDNLVRWLKDPKAVEPGTAMPNLGLSDQQTHDIAAYLYTLR